MEKKKKKQFAIGIVILVILIIAILLCLRSCNTEPPDSTEPTTELTTNEPKALDFEAATEQEKITIPATTGLSLKSETVQQTVNFHNPETNNCYFQLSLYLSDDTLLYQSDYLKPSEQITNIELTQTLEKGKYRNCRLVFDCFTLDESKEPLNSGTVILEITAQ